MPSQTSPSIWPSSNCSHTSSPPKTLRLQQGQLRGRESLRGAVESSISSLNSWKRSTKPPRPWAATPPFYWMSWSICLPWACPVVRECHKEESQRVHTCSSTLHPTITSYYIMPSSLVIYKPYTGFHVSSFPTLFSFP